MENKPFRPNQQRGGRRGFKNFGFIALIILFGLILFAAYGQPQSLKEIPLTQAVSDSNHGKYSQIRISGNELDITLKGQNQPTLKAYDDPNTSLKDQGFDLTKDTFQYKAQSSTSSTLISIGVQYVLPVLVIGLLFYFMLRSAQGQGNQALSF